MEKHRIVDEPSGPTAVSPLKRVADALERLGEAGIVEVTADSGVDRALAAACLDSLVRMGRVQKIEWKPPVSATASCGSPGCASGFSSEFSSEFSSGCAGVKRPDAPASETAAASLREMRAEGVVVLYRFVRNPRGT